MKKLTLMLAVLLMTASSAVADDFGQDNIVIVLDASGSMGGNISGTNIKKMDAAKDAIWGACKDLPADTKIGLLVFSASNMRNDWAYPLSEIDKERLKEAVYLPRDGGSTPLGTYIKKGADALLVERKKQLNYGTFRLIVVTDGEADWGREAKSMVRFAEEIPTRGLRMDVIGVDINGDHALKEHAHSYIAANDTKTLDQAMKTLLVESLSSDTGADALDDSLLDAFGGNIEGVYAMMQNLSNVANQAIGEEPLVELLPVQPVDGQESPADTVQADDEEGGGGFAIVLILLLVLVVIGIFGCSLANRNRRG